MSSLKSDLTLSTEKFDPASIPEHSTKTNQKLLALFDAQPQWWEVGAAKFRLMRERGETTFPRPVYLPTANNIAVPSRDSSRTIPCRLIYPNNDKEKSACKGIFLHIHGGGWVLFNEKTQDTLLELYANNSGCVVLSVGYRLAPEDPFPAGIDDCADVAEWLVDKGEEKFGGSLKFLGGESAGGHLSVVTALHLLRSRPSHTLSGLVLHFGVYDLTATRSTKPFPGLNSTTYDKFLDAFAPPEVMAKLPNGLQNPAISPYFEDLEKFRGKLPSALFTCGTVDILLNDSVLMATKWLMAGGEAILKIYPGAIHGFTGFPKDVIPQSKEALDDAMAFIMDKMTMNVVEQLDSKVE